MRPWRTVRRLEAWVSTVAEDEQDGPLSALAKGLLVMEALVEAGRPLPLSAVVARTQLPKATAHRAVRVLVQRGWAQQTDHGYWLGNRLLQAASAFEGSLDLRRETRPALEMLRDEFDETVHLATLDQEYRVIYLEKLVPSSQVVGLVRGSGVGYTAPAYCTGVGKAMLAFLSPEDLDKFFAMTELVALTPQTLHTHARISRRHFVGPGAKAMPPTTRSTSRVLRASVPPYLGGRGKSSQPSVSPVQSRE